MLPANSKDCLWFECLRISAFKSSLIKVNTLGVSRSLEKFSMRLSSISPSGSSSHYQESHKLYLTILWTVLSHFHSNQVIFDNEKIATQVLLFLHHDLLKGHSEELYY